MNKFDEQIMKQTLFEVTINITKKMEKEKKKQKLFPEDFSQIIINL